MQSISSLRTRASYLDNQWSLSPQVFDELVIEVADGYTFRILKNPALNLIWYSFGRLLPRLPRERIQTYVTGGEKSCMAVTGWERVGVAAVMALVVTSVTRVLMTHLHTVSCAVAAEPLKTLCKKTGSSMIALHWRLRRWRM